MKTTPLEALAMTGCIVLATCICMMLNRPAHEITHERFIYGTVTFTNVVSETNYVEMIIGNRVSLDDIGIHSAMPMEMRFERSSTGFPIVIITDTFTNTSIYTSIRP